MYLKFNFVEGVNCGTEIAASCDQCPPSMCSGDCEPEDSTCVKRGNMTNSKTL